MANRRRMTAAERRRFNAIKARVAARKLAEDIDTEEDLDEVETPEIEDDIEEARIERAYAAYRARKRAQEAKEDEEPSEEEKKEAMRRRALARARRAASGRAYRRKRAQEISDDLTGPEGDSSHIEQLDNGGKHVSDDLTDPDEGDGGIEQVPPASVDEAEDKVLAAYNLIDKQVANKIIASNVHRASLARKYCRQHTLREMKFAAAQLDKIGSAKKTAGNVRVTRRGSGIQNKRTASRNGMDASILFY